ncbi:hypothetical protein [Burkholderia sp. NLJ2]|uniref:hypothetical protein n=1 Tax=Burkholderia sp. NLJ2 TaxID=3090699 RepID=UPI003C6C0103
MNFTGQGNHARHRAATGSPAVHHSVWRCKTTASTRTKRIVTVYGRNRRSSRVEWQRDAQFDNCCGDCASRDEDHVEHERVANTTYETAIGMRARHGETKVIGIGISHLTA